MIPVLSMPPVVDMYTYFRYCDVCTQLALELICSKKQCHPGIYVCNTIICCPCTLTMMQADGFNAFCSLLLSCVKEEKVNFKKLECKREKLLPSPTPYG